MHCGSEQPDAGTPNQFTFPLAREWVSRRMSRAHEQNKQCKASKWKSRQASSPVLMSLFWVVVNHSAMVLIPEGNRKMIFRIFNSLSIWKITDNFIVRWAVVSWLCFPPSTHIPNFLYIIRNLNLQAARPILRYQSYFSNGEFRLSFLS